MEKVDELLDYQYDYRTEDSNHKMHLGRRNSDGLFVFCGSLADHIDIRSNLKEHLEEILEGWQIMDEYDTRWDFGSFWKMVNKKKNPSRLDSYRELIDCYHEIIDGHIFTTFKGSWT